VTRDGWVQYAEYARRLDSVRSEELARTAGIRASVAQMSTHADELETRLGSQGVMLINLATILRLRRPKLTPVAPELEGLIDPSTGLTHVAQAIDATEAQALEASKRGHYPLLFPKLSSMMRSLVIYGGAALVVLLLQILAFRNSGDNTNPILVLFLIPAICFGIAFLVISIGNRTRVVQEAIRGRTRLGFVLCFGIGPIAAALLIASSLTGKK